MRSCALRIFDAETISSARVTLRVFCTLLIFDLISRPPAMCFARYARLRESGPVVSMPAGTFASAGLDVTVPDSLLSGAELLTSCRST